MQSRHAPVLTQVHPEVWTLEPDHLMVMESIKSISYLAQVSMDELHSHCPLANTGSDTLDGAVPHISSGEDAGDTGLQEERFAVKRPTLWRLSLVYQVGTSENEALLVTLHHTLQPACVRLRANENEQRGRR